MQAAAKDEAAIINSILFNVSKLQVKKIKEDAAEMDIRKKTKLTYLLVDF
jgi:hypothetical protein